MLKRVLATALVLFGIVSTAFSAPKSFVGTVEGVIDGDTLRFERGGKIEKVRLYGVDSPEKKQDYGAEAQSIAAEMSLGKVVCVEVMSTDQYHRTVGVVILPGKVNLNHEMVKRGLAWWYKEVAPNSVQLPKLQEAAKDAKLGLWSKPNPIPPWQFREHDNSGGKDDSKGAHNANPDLVYVGEKSECYHRQNCCTLKNSTKQEISRSEAIKAHLRPCKICKPK
ncbi:MAG: thermonuclease family protein [Armatimonadota bacterium]